MTRHAVTAWVETPTGRIELDVIAATIARDEQWAPYAQAEFTIPVPSRSLLDTLDPRSGVRIGYQVTRSWSPDQTLSAISGHAITPARMTALLSPVSVSRITAAWEEWTRYAWYPLAEHRDIEVRSGLLWLASRDRDVAAGTLRLVAVSGELLLQDRGLLSQLATKPPTPFIRDIVTGVLASIGHQLEPRNGSDLAEVDYDATTHEPGVTLWDYLTPLLESTNRRLWCDEAGRWYLESREEVKPGHVDLTLGVSAITAAAESLNRADNWYDSVVVTYRWTDVNGEDRVTHDLAIGAVKPTRTLLVERDTPRPSAGAAKVILRRAQHRGRGFSATIVSDYSVNPGSSAALDLADGSTPFLGYVTTTTWRFPEDETDIGTRGLVASIPTSWLNFPPGQSWLDFPPGLSWVEAGQRLPVWVNLPEGLAWLDVAPGIAWADAGQLVPSYTETI